MNELINHFVLSNINLIRRLKSVMEKPDSLSDELKEHYEVIAMLLSTTVVPLVEHLKKNWPEDTHGDLDFINNLGIQAVRLKDKLIPLCDCPACALVVKAVDDAKKALEEKQAES